MNLVVAQLFLLLLISPIFSILSQAQPHIRRPSSSHKRLIPSFESAFIDISSNASHSPLPLSRISIINPNNANLHPQIVHQQHLNRANRRHAIMTKRAVPSDEELTWRLKKRMSSIVVEDSNLKRLRKRQRMGKAASSMKTSASQDVELPGVNVLAATINGQNAGVSQVDENAAAQNSVVLPIAPTGVNSLGLAIEANDVGYFANIQIGTPPTTFRILMDSGSSDTWVASTACTNCGPHTRLGSKTSSSFVTGNVNFQVTYGTGNVQGTLIKDNVQIAGLSLPAHSFGVTTSESSQFSANNIPFDGLMGLAKSILSEQKVPTPIEALKASGAVTSAQMGYHLARISDGTNDGQITFGGVDASKFVGKLTEFPNVNAAGFWEGSLDDVSVDGVSLGFKGRTAILDTGTSLMVVPAADAAAIHAAIPGSTSDGQGGFTVPCTLASSVALSFAGTAFSISPEDIAFLPLNPKNLAGQCTSGISAGSVGGANQWLVGDVFLKNVYFATDIESNSIGLAPSIAA